MGFYGIPAAAYVLPYQVLLIATIEQNWMDCLKDDFQAFGATDGSTVDNRLTFGVDRAVWTLAAKMDDGAPWHKGVLQGAEKFMASWQKEEEEASRRRATKRDSRDLEPPTHL